MRSNISSAGSENPAPKVQDLQPKREPRFEIRTQNLEPERATRIEISRESRFE